MAVNIVNKDLESFQFQEGRPTQSTPVTYRPTRPLLPIAISPAILTKNAVSTIKNNLIAAITPTDSDPFLQFRGAWQSFIAYNINDVVLFNSSAYVAIQASVNSQPDNNPLNWTLLSENLVFNTTFTPTLTVGGFGPLDKTASATGNSSTASVSATPAATGEIALLQIEAPTGVASVPGFTFLSNASNGGGGSTLQLWYKVLPDASAVTATANLSSSGAWAVNLALLQFGGFNTFGPISQIEVNSGGTNLVVTVANTLVAGNTVVLSGLTNATFLNNQTLIVATANSTSFTASFTHANYGPAADIGTVTLVAYQQTTLSSGAWFPPNPVQFSNNVKLNTIFCYVLGTQDAAGTATISGPSDTNLNSYTVANANRANATASIAISAPNKTAGNKPTITTGGNTGSSAGYWTIELAGSAATLFNYVPYDVVEFRGSVFVCLQETTSDAFAQPSSWGLLGPATGFAQVKTASYPAVQSDEGNLLSFNSSSAVTLTLPNPLPTVNGLTDSGWWIAVENIGTGSLTVSPNGLTLDNGGSLVLFQNQGCLIFTNGSNFLTFRAASSGSGFFGGVNVQTVNYPAVFGDGGKLISMNGSNLTLTLPNPPPNSMWAIAGENLNATDLTIARNGLTIDGAASNLTLGQNQGIIIYTNGTNYFTLHGVNRLTMPNIFSVTAPDGSGNVTVTLANQNAKKFLGGPVACSADAVPTFRQPQGSDLLNLSMTSVSGTSAVSQSGSLQLCSAVLPAGLYRVSVYMVVANVGAGNLGATITWNDGVASQSVSPATISTTALGTVAQFDLRVLSDGVHNIAYTFTLS